MDNKSKNEYYMVMNSSLRDLLWVIFKHKGKILLIYLAIFIPSLYWISRQQAKYQSMAKILVKEGRENYTPATAVEIPNRIVDITRAEDINSEIEILRSRLLAEKIVEKLGIDLKKSKGDQLTRGQVIPSSPVSPVHQSLRTILHEFQNLMRHFLPFIPSAGKGISPFESAVLRVQRGLNIRQAPGSNVILVTFSDTDPAVTVDVINTLLDFYLDQHLMVHKTPGAYQFFSEQAIQYKEVLEESEKNLEEFKKKWSLAELKLQRDLLIQEIGKYENTFQQTATEIDELKERLIQQKEQLKDQKEKICVSEIAQRNPVLNQLNLDLSKLKLQEKKLLEKFIDENHREIKDVRQGIQELESQIKEFTDPVQAEVTTSINVIYQSLTQSILNNQTELESLEVKKRNSERQLSAARQKLAALSERELELNRLERQIKTNEENYQMYRKKVEENRISDAMDIARFANISIIEPALTPLEPLPDKKRFKMVMSILLGLASGLGLALLFEFIDHSISNAEELESYLNIPVLGSIPNFKK